MSTYDNIQIGPKDPFCHLESGAEGILSSLGPAQIAIVVNLRLGWDRIIDSRCGRPRLVRFSAISLERLSPTTQALRRFSALIYIYIYCFGRRCCESFRVRLIENYALDECGESLEFAVHL